MDEQSTALQWDTDEAVRFLQNLDPDGPWCLAALIPDGAIETRTFDIQETQQMRNWIEGYQNNRNLYYTFNRALPSLSKKPIKEEITHGRGTHTDVDIDDEDALPEALARIKNYDPSPTFIIFSGGGYQGGWKFDQLAELKTAGDVEFIESYNRHIAHSLTGGDNCHNIDRLMRLPGTVNLPNAKKRQRGRVPIVAHLVHEDWSLTYRESSFPTLSAEEVKTTRRSKPKAAPHPTTGATHTNPLVQ